MIGKHLLKFFYLYNTFTNSLAETKVLHRLKTAVKEMLQNE